LPFTIGKTRAAWAWRPTRVTDEHSVIVVHAERDLINAVEHLLKGSDHKFDP